MCPPPIHGESASALVRPDERIVRPAIQCPVVHVAHAARALRAGERMRRRWREPRTTVANTTEVAHTACDVLGSVRRRGKAVPMVAPATPNPFKNFDPATLGAEQNLGLTARPAPSLRLLVVDPDPAAAPSVCEAIGGVQGKLTVRRRAKRAAPDPDIRPTVFAAANLTEARKSFKKLASRGQSVDLVIVEDAQPEGDADLLGELLSTCPAEARLVVTSRVPSLGGSIAAFRVGALDYLPKPLDPAVLAQRLRLAAGRRYVQVKDQRRLGRLKSAVRQLNQARRTVGQKVDVLCQDLVGAYGELARQVERVRVQEHFRELLASAADLEQLLCHCMDWLLRELGHCNIAVFLTDDDGKSELGAYMKHTIPGDAGVTRCLAEHVIPRVTADGLLHVGGDSGDPLTGAPSKAMHGQSLLAVDCTYLAESLATLIVFRRSEKPFGGDELELLKAAAPVFATAITNLVRSGGTEAGARGDDENEDGEEWRRGGTSTR